MLLFYNSSDILGNCTRSHQPLGFRALHVFIYAFYRMMLHVLCTNHDWPSKYNIFFASCFHIYNSRFHSLVINKLFDGKCILSKSNSNFDVPDPKRIKSVLLSFQSLKLWYFSSYLSYRPVCGHCFFNKFQKIDLNVTSDKWLKM